MEPTMKKIPSRENLIAKLAFLHGGHNAHGDSCGRLGSCVDLMDDEAVADYFYRSISADAQKPLEAEILRLKSFIFDRIIETV